MNDLVAFESQTDDPCDLSKDDRLRECVRKLIDNFPPTSIACAELRGLNTAKHDDHSPS